MLHRNGGEGPARFPVRQRPSRPLEAGQQHPETRQVTDSHGLGSRGFPPRRPFPSCHNEQAYQRQELDIIIGLGVTLLEELFGGKVGQEGLLRTASVGWRGRYTCCMKTLLVVILVLILIFAALAVSRPDQASFDQFLGRAAAVPGGNLLQRAGAALAEMRARMTTEYHDHALWATGEAVVNGRHQRYLGIAGTWIRLSSGEAAAEDAPR